MNCRQMTADVVFFPCWTWEEGLDDDVYYCIGERLKLEGETENMGVCTKERKGILQLPRYSWPLPVDFLPALPATSRGDLDA